jgi:Nucleotide-diphospho-sugar transferase
MTNTSTPDAAPVVALLCTCGLEAFLSNALRGILQTGVDPGQIRVGCPRNALESVSRIAKLHSARIHLVSNQKLSENEPDMTSYAGYGSKAFTDISWKKISFLRTLIEAHHHVIYSDLDIAWIRNPLPYLSGVASAYPMAFQTEGLPRFPSALCFGFVSLIRSDRTIAFLDALIESDAVGRAHGERLDDQPAGQRLIENDPAWLRDIFCLPESLFLNGLGYRNLQNTGPEPCPMVGELLPFVFHANWTVGAENKRKLLAQTGTWLIEDAPELD